MVFLHRISRNRAQREVAMFLLFRTIVWVAYCAFFSGGLAAISHKEIVSPNGWAVVIVVLCMWGIFALVRRNPMLEGTVASIALGVAFVLLVWLPDNLIYHTAARLSVAQVSVLIPAFFALMALSQTYSGIKQERPYIRKSETPR
jgi:hypothetical protein